MAQLIECHTAKQKVNSLAPGQHTCQVADPASVEHMHD